MTRDYLVTAGWGGRLHFFSKVDLQGGNKLNSTELSVNGIHPSLVMGGSGKTIFQSLNEPWFLFPFIPI